MVSLLGIYSISQKNKNSGSFDILRSCCLPQDRGSHIMFQACSFFIMQTAGIIIGVVLQSGKILLLY